MPREAFGGGSFIRVNALVYTTEVTDLSGAGAVQLINGFVPGYISEIEEFGAIVQTALVGGGGTQTYQIRDATSTGGNLLAQLTVLQTAADASIVKTSAYTTSGDGLRDAFKQIRDTTSLFLYRIAGGTTITAGQLLFYLKVRQHLQVR